MHWQIGRGRKSAQDSIASEKERLTVVSFSGPLTRTCKQQVTLMIQQLYVSKRDTHLQRCPAMAPVGRSPRLKAPAGGPGGGGGGGG